MSISSTYPVGWYVCLLVSYSQFQISTLLVSLELDPRGTSNLGTMGCHIILKAMTKGYLMVSVGGVLAKEDAKVDPDRGFTHPFL